MYVFPENNLNKLEVKYQMKYGSLMCRFKNRLWICRNTANITTRFLRFGGRLDFLDWQ